MKPSEVLELRAYAAVVLRERQEVATRCGSKTAYGTRAQAERSIRRASRLIGAGIIGMLERGE